MFANSTHAKIKTWTELKCRPKKSVKLRPCPTETWNIRNIGTLADFVRFLHIMGGCNVNLNIVPDAQLAYGYA